MRKFSCAGAAAPGFISTPPGGGLYQRQVQAAETRLLYENACTGIVATIVIGFLFAYEQWFIVSPSVVSLWLLDMLLTSAARFMLVRRYWRVSPSDPAIGRWNAAFVVGAAMAAAGWGTSAIVL